MMQTKRSRYLTLTTVMATASVSLVACDQPYEAGSATWQDRPVQIEQGKAVDAFTYTTLEQCKAADQVPDEACDDAMKTAVADQDKTPRFAQQQSCEEIHGVGQCVPRSDGQGGSFFTPLLTGFIVGQMLNGGYRGTGYYRDRDGGSYTPYGGTISTDYATGRSRVGAGGIDPPESVKSIPPKVQTRTSVVSRGGFGGRMSARSYSGRGFGA